MDLFVDQADDPAVARAAGDLAADLERVSGVRPRLRRTQSGMSGTAVLIGTIGASPVIDRLIAEGRLDTAEVAGRWEASVTQVVANPLPGVAQALVIAGSDRRGAVYGSLRHLGANRCVAVVLVGRRAGGTPRPR